MSLTKIVLASLTLGIVVGCFFVFTVLSFDPDADFHDINMNLYVGRLVINFLSVAAIVGLAVLILVLQFGALLIYGAGFLPSKTKKNQTDPLPKIPAG